VQKYFLLFLMLIALSLQAQNNSDENLWVENTYNAMDLDERIGQLMMIRAHSDKGPEHIAEVKKYIEDYKVGGLCFFQGTPEKQVELINDYQKLSPRVPMMVSMDAEWGLGMRFKKDGFSYPYQLTLGAVQDNRLIYDMGKDIARQLRRVGVHISFSPVLDVNNNPKNPVINIRSFGEDRYNVAAKGYMYMRGLQDNNVMACAKHFPGHGDTDVDSHYDLPVISHDKNRLDSIELFPFKVLSQHGIQSTMIAHLQIPAIDDRPNMPTTLSNKTVTNLLKEEIGFNGLIFTDALEMKGVTKHHGEGEVEAKCLEAGNDILLLPESLEAAFKTIKEYLKEGRITEASIEDSVKKILRSKYRLGLTTFEPISENNIRKELETPEAKNLKRKLVEQSMTMVRNQNNLVPFANFDKANIASLGIGAKRGNVFQNRLKKYVDIRQFTTNKEVSDSKIKELVSALKNKKTVIISLHDMSRYASKNFGISSGAKKLIAELNKTTEVVLVIFGSPYSLTYFDDIENVLVAYQETEVTEDVAAQALFGAISMRGRLPVTASPKSKFNDGVNTIGLFRMGYDIPESVGINSDSLVKIDELMEEAIRTEATPGGVVLIAKDGKVVFEKGYGYHTYSKKKAVSTDDIYDLASVTKIAAATLSVMKLHEEGKINVYRPMSEYLPALKNTNKVDLTIQEIMTHRASLQGWIKFYEETTTKSKRPSTKFYKKIQTDDFSIPVTESLFLKTGYENDIRKAIYDSPLRSSKNYKYSDLGFYLIADMVRAVTGQSINQYVQEQFYKPMGLQTMTYNPWRKFSLDRIPPTERDKYFRQQKVHGYVHDMGSAMLGGVSGHAGLFSNIGDLAKVLQMFLNSGYYGGKKYLEAATIKTFTTRCAGCTRRGIGFDMLQLDRSVDPNFSTKASHNTFGHLGFTGICAWVDPDYGLIYILLSNRTYPSMRNYKFSRENYRPRIQSVIYNAMNYVEELN